MTERKEPQTTMALIYRKDTCLSVVLGTSALSRKILTMFSSYKTKVVLTPAFVFSSTIVGLIFSIAVASLPSNYFCSLLRSFVGMNYLRK